ncbi:MAG: methylmalonyl-CoA epimerase [Flavobacteriales bacterium]|jgi:methylmalonyl-CoA/ethylmalonyl-CoA epimerase
MVRKIEHIGIAVKDLQASNKIFEDLLGVAPYKEEAVESEHVITSFFQVGESKIELLQATSPDSAIAKFLEKNKEGIHHIAFDVEDIHVEIERLKNKGYTMIHDVPKEGADGKIIAFLHPKSSNSVLVELCQDRFKK